MIDHYEVTRASMIDIEKEQLLTLEEAAKRLPGRSGKRQSIQTMYRWVYKGVLRNGERVRLESVLIGKSRFTSAEAFSGLLTSALWRTIPPRQGPCLARLTNE